jgi:hypothetical protein
MTEMKLNGTSNNSRTTGRTNGSANEDEDKVSLDLQASRPISGPVFVIGVWRSGTSLLYALLNQHPDIGLFYEGDLAVLEPMFHVSYSRKNWLRRWEYWNAGVSRHRLESFRPSASITSLAEAAEAAGCEYCRTKGARIWGCKSPSYYDRLVRLARDFPHARFVVIWRDPEDICRSIRNAAAHSRWFAGSGMMRRAILGCEMLRKQCDVLVSRGVPLHQIHYKELVEDTPNTMRGICEFLDVPFIPAVTSLEGADRGAVFEGGHHSLVKGTQIVSSRERKATLSPETERKVRRYKALWKAQAGEEWLLCRYLSDASETTPGNWERLTDGLLFSLLRFKDAVPRLAYSVLPLWVWIWYRWVKYHKQPYHDKPSLSGNRQKYVADRQDAQSEVAHQRTD